LRDPGGNLRGFSEFSHDLTERKEMEARYRGLLEAAPDAMVVVNVGGGIVLLNVRAEKEFGYAVNTTLARNCVPSFRTRMPCSSCRPLAAVMRSISSGLPRSISSGGKKHEKLRPIIWSAL
jgi:PAS domain-containing protein